MATPLVHLSLHQILDRQMGVVARPQLIRAGIDDHAIYRRVRDGTWVRLLPGVYKVIPGAPSLDQRRIAAALFAGERAQLTGAATLLWYGFRSPMATDRVHVIVPHDTRRRSSGFVIVQRTLALDDDARDAGLYHVTSPPRAVVDACRLATDLQIVRSIVAEAVQGNHASIDALDEQIRRAARSRTALARRALMEVIDGARSSPEAELRGLTLRSRILPEVVWNPILVSSDGAVLPTPDGWIAAGAIALEVDSREYHSDDEGWRRTLRRHNMLSELGVLVLHFTPAEIRAEPARVLRVIEQAYRNRIGITAMIQTRERAPL